MIKWLRSLSKSMLIVVNGLAVIALLLAYLCTHVSPEKISFLALFGIGYGFSLLINIFFIAFWLVVKKRLALLSLMAILLGYTHLAAYFQLFPKFQGATNTEQSLHILSQNVKLFGWYNWRSNIQDRDEMIKELEIENADVLCFQEFFHNSSPGIFETKAILKRTLGTPYLYDSYVATIRNDQHYGIATLSKYPIVNGGRINFEGERSNVCIFTDIKLGVDTIRIYNAHVASIRFHHEDYIFFDEMTSSDQQPDNAFEKMTAMVGRLSEAYKRRAGQVQTIMDHVAESPYPVLVCGDFNDTPVSYSYSQLSNFLTDSFRESGWGLGSTYIGQFPSFRIDYIFHSPTLQSSDYQTLNEKISDHHAISCRVHWQ